MKKVRFVEFLGRYIDACCIYYRKPFFDSGIFGRKAHVQVVIPFLTESYSSVVDPPEPSVPIDVYLNFPSINEHAVLWAKYKFNRVMIEPVQQAKEFIDNSQEFIQQLAQNSEECQVEIVENIIHYLIRDRPKDFIDCIKWVNFYQ